MSQGARGSPRETALAVPVNPQHASPFLSDHIHKPMPDQDFTISFADAFSLKDELAVVTGGGSGLGLAMARAFTLAGARVILVGRREEQLKSAASELGPLAAHAVYDVRDVEHSSDFAGRIEKEHGTATILVNNAGNHVKKPIEEHTEADFRAVLDTHVVGAFGLSRAFVPAMKRLGRGNLLFTASMTSFIGMTNVVAYSVAKSAYLGFVHSLAVELSPSGIRVNGIAPGWIETEILRRAVLPDPERKAKILSRTPMARFGLPEDIGWAAVYICSPAARFISGVVLPVDGGASIGL